METLHVGSITVQPIADGTAILTPDMFTVADTSVDFSAHAHLVDVDGRMVVPVGAFLVRTGSELVLLDAGVGDTHDAMFDGGALLANLAAAGVQPGDISTVAVSHLHSDHMGWLSNDGASTFPNARIRIGAPDWEFFVERASATSARAEKLRVIAEQVDLVHNDGEPIAAGMTSRMTPGHTPGHMSTVISSGEHRMIVLGDSLHCPAQLTETEWEFLFDVDRALAVKTRQALLQEAEDPNTVLLPMHFPDMQATRLLAGKGKKYWSLSSDLAS